MAPPSPTHRLALREMTPQDLDNMAALLGDPRVMAFYDHPKSRAEAEAWITWNERLYRERGFGLWLIERRGRSDFVGDCGLTPQEVEGTVEIEVGYHIRYDLQGRGYATEVAGACRDYARDLLRLDRLIALIHPDNRASQRVAERIGMAFERDTVRPSGKTIRLYAMAL